MAEPRYMVLVGDGSATTAALHDAAREEAWSVAREQRATGRAVWIVRVDGGRHECVVAEDDPL